MASCIGVQKCGKGQARTGLPTHGLCVCVGGGVGWAGHPDPAWAPQYPILYLSIYHPEGKQRQPEKLPQ